MGYDMYWKQEPAEVQEAYAAVHAADSYDADVWQRWSTAQDKYGSYFRLNIFGMDRYRAYMAERGMLARVDAPAWPEWQAFGVTQAEYDEWTEDEAQQSANFRQWRAAVKTNIEGETGGVMPSYKFGSNDGWLVTPAEITRSLVALEAWETKKRQKHGDRWRDPLRDENGGYWDRWIRFLYCARSHGGVVVK